MKNNSENRLTLNHSAPLPKSSLVIWIISICFFMLLIWAWLFELAEVSVGTGKVIPSAKEQTIQSLDGGILAELLVKEGDIVQAEQILAKLDPTRMASNLGETASLLRVAKATSARLKAEVNQTDLIFPDDVLEDKKLVAEETALYRARISNLEESLVGLRHSQNLIEKELHMTQPLVAKGAASEVEVLRLERQLSDLKNQAADLKNQFMVQAREELAKANADIQAQQQIANGKADTLSRTTFKAPMRSIVKEIDVMTLGGVIPQNGNLMTLVPLDEKLMIETRISPRDIAFIHPEQDAVVKITAYDYSIYGGLKGKVKVISPDTLRDEVKQDQYYYRVYIQTDTNLLKNAEGQPFAITPGMVATVDIQTGQKSIIDYLVKPFNKAQEALRER